MARCVACGEPMAPALCDMEVSTDEGGVVVLDVPGWRCPQCGRRSVPADIARRADEIASEPREGWEMGRTIVRRYVPPHGEVM
jgi:YgiT-type zinc finger domain-containing protein